MFRPLLLAAALGVATNPHAATATGLDKAFDHPRIEEYVVTASPLEKTSDAVSQAITRLAGDELRRRAAATLGETLEGQAGITGSSFGPSVGTPVIRGQTGNRVRVLQDSIGTLDAASSSPDHSLAVEPLLAERIEVLRGPASLRYGSGAIGGVVNVLDNRIPDKLPEHIEGALEYRHRNAGDNDNTVAMLEGGRGALAWHLDGIHRHSNDLDIPGPARSTAEAGGDESADDHLPNSDSRARQLTAGLSAVADWGYAGASVSVLDNNYGIPGGAHGPEEDNTEPDHGDGDTGTRIDLAQTRTDIKAELLAPLPGIEKLALRLGHNDYRHIELENGTPGTRFDNDAWESRIELLHEPLGAWRGAIGLQGQRRDYAAVGDEAFIPRSTIDGYGLFLMEELGGEPWRLELGLRAENQTVDPEQLPSIDHALLSAAAALHWDLRPGQHLNLHINRSQRAPSVEELLSRGPHLATGSFDLGDPDLTEETALGIELGYHYHGPVKLALSLFRNEFRNFIYQENTGTGDPESGLPVYRYRQQGAVFQGLEAQLSVPLGAGLELEIFTDRVRAQLNDGADVPRIPPARYGLAIRFDQGAWQAGLGLTEVRAQNRPGSQESPTPGHTRLDGDVSYSLVSGPGQWLFFLKAGNLLDEEIRNATSFLRDAAPEAGRNVTAGLRYGF